MRSLLIAGAVAIAIPTPACTVGANSAGEPRGGAVRVFAASSLTEAFTSLGPAFETKHPTTDIQFSFGASSALARQIADGAPADVFVSADEATIRSIDATRLAEPPARMARNRLAIIVEPGNPKRIRGLTDLARDDVVLVMCAPQVPCGALGAAALEKAGVRAQPRSLEENVKGVVAKVTLGEADAGIVYTSDVTAAGRAADGVAIDIANDPGLTAEYWVAVTRSATVRAEQWVSFLLSAEGQAVLAGYGFLAP